MTLPDTLVSGSVHNFETIDGAGDVVPFVMSEAPSRTAFVHGPETPVTVD